jgi:hypothetical protein
MNPNIQQVMNRREAVWRIAVLMGGAMVGSELLMSGQAIPDKAPTAAFTDDDRALLDEIGETIIPVTDIPGAKAVKIGAFMTLMVNDCYNDKQHAVFAAGLGKINDASRAKFGCSFLQATPEQRTALANALDTDQKAYNTIKAKDEPSHYFRMMKELTILGYFTSEIGCTQAVKYVEVPGAYHGDVPYAKGDRAWF